MIGSRPRWHLIVMTALGLLGPWMAGPECRAQDQAGSLSAAFRHAAARGKGALVAIRAVDGRPPGAPAMAPRVGRIGPLPLPGLDPFGPLRVGSIDVASPAACTGIIIDADRGIILTTDRPTEGYSALLVTFPDGTERLASQVRRDPRVDLALVVVDVRGLKLEAAAWGDPGRLQPGDWVVALGQPGAGMPSLSAGIMSARRRSEFGELIETDAAIARVGAGGPLLNLAGDVIGINRGSGRRADGHDGMGYAIPADRARRVADELARFGQVRRGQLGVRVEPVDPTAIGRRGSPAGVRITEVHPGTPAAEAGLRAGDLILAAGKLPIDDVIALQEVVDQAPTDEDLVLLIERQGRQSRVPVRPRPLRAETAPAPAPPAGSRPPVESRSEPLPVPAGPATTPPDRAVPPAAPGDSPPQPVPPPAPAPVRRSDPPP